MACFIRTSSALRVSAAMMLRTRGHIMPRALGTSITNCKSLIPVGERVTRTAVAVLLIFMAAAWLFFRLVGPVGPKLRFWPG